MHSRFSLIWFFLFFVTYSFSQTANITPESAGISTHRLDRYEDFLEREIENRNIPGAVSLIVRHGQVVHKKAFGYSSLASEEHMQTNKIFYIQSMTKPIISVAFMMLYEEGHFFLTDPVSKYLPAFKNLKVASNVDNGAAGQTIALNKQVTIAHLLTHTAGFSHGLGSSKLDNDILRALYFNPHEDIESRVNTLLGMPLIGHPGEQWYYSASPDVLALLIEHFSGMPVSEFLQKRLFDPLKMKDTGYNLAASKRSRMVQLHRYA